MVEDINKDNPSKPDNSTNPPEPKPEKNIIEEAKEEREKIEKAREDLKKENDRAEKLAVAIQLAGKSKGAAAPEKTDMERYEEDTAERYRGTGMNPSKGYKRRW